MNEDAAREVLLVRALETSAGSRALVDEADRLHAGRTAAELARWDATRGGGTPSAEGFVAHRARLLVERVGAAQPAVARAARALAWRPALATGLALAALLAGLLVEQVSDRGRVNLLAFPLFGIVAWNLLVYAWLLLAALRPAPRRARAAPPGGSGAGAAGVASVAPAARAPVGPLRAALLRLAMRTVGATRGPHAAALASFAADWSRAVAPLARARAARILHVAAALFALGAVAGLYLRGLVFDYRVGWESTFLGAPAVRSLLGAVLGPAAALLGVTLPDVAGIASLRFPAGAGGAAAATWIHLHALTVGLAAILPRLALGAFAGWREARLARALPLDLGTPYFRRLLAPFLRGESRLRVVPYSYAPDEPASEGLRAIAVALLGESAQLALAPTVPYGEESRAAADLAAGDSAVPLTLALFSLAATPEVENHGRFLAALRDAAGARRPLAVLVDEGPYRRRLGAAAEARLEERRRSWESFAAARELPVACVDLGAPDLAALERRLAAVIGGGGAPASGADAAAPGGAAPGHGGAAP
jgi:hypothetical protein